MKTMAMIKQIAKQAFWDLFDYLGRLIVINLMGIILLYLCTILLSFGGLIIPVITLLIVAPLILNFWIAGYSAFLGGITNDQDPSLKYFFVSGKSSYALTLFPTIVVFATLYLLTINLNFYTALSVDFAKYHLVLFTLLGFLFWASLMIMFAMLHLAIYRSRVAEKAHWKYGFYFIIKYPAITIFFTLFVAIFILSIIFTRLALFVPFGLILPLLILHSIQDVVFDDEQARAEDDVPEQKRVSSWKEIVEEEGVQESERLIKSRYDRTLRDILKPWGDHQN